MITLVVQRCFFPKKQKNVFDKGCKNQFTFTGQLVEKRINKRDLHRRNIDNGLDMSYHAINNYKLWARTRLSSILYAPSDSIHGIKEPVRTVRKAPFLAGIQCISAGTNAFLDTQLGDCPRLTTRNTIKINTIGYYEKKEGNWDPKKIHLPLLQST